MPDVRLIDANALETMFLRFHMETDPLDADWFTPYLFVQDAPTIDAVTVVHARWVQEDEDAWRCTCCGAFWTFIDGGPEENDARFCPVCGAKMDAKEG